MLRTGPSGRRLHVSVALPQTGSRGVEHTCRPGRPEDVSGVQGTEDLYRICVLWIIAKEVC